MQCVRVVQSVYVCRYDGSTRQASFSVGLQGTAEEDVEKVKHIISQTLKEVIA